MVGALVRREQNEVLRSVKPEDGGLGSWAEAAT